MLHNKVYNEIFTNEMRMAYINRDHEYFHHAIETAKQQELSEDVVSLLLVLCALHDALTTGGEAVSFVLDFINL